jgi:FkbM family methyltransferase
LVYDRSVNYHAILGLWELPSFRVLCKMVEYLKRTRPRFNACDVGANIGMFTLWLSQQLRDRGTVFAFEPSPSVLPKLRQNLTSNRAQNVMLVEEACSNTVGTIDFYIGFHHHTSSLHADWAGGGQIVPERINVRTTTLDEFFHQDHREPPDLIKMDIEGSGTHALPGCEACVAEKRPLILVESHTHDEDRALSDLVLRHDYSAYRINGGKWVKYPKQIHPHPDGLWGRLLLCPSEHVDHFVKCLS